MRCRTLDQLNGDEVLAKEIYTDEFQTILPQGAVLKPAYIARLKELGIQKVYVVDEDPLAEEVVILKAEMETNVKEKIKNVLERHTYQNNEDLVQLCDEADKVIGTIAEEDEVIEQVYDIKERNADVYEHSLSICTLAVLVALKMQLPQEVIHDIGVSCLLHDIGLRYLTIDYADQDVEILSQSDLAEYKKHPVYGYAALKDETWISDLSKSIILQHHERLDGSGYPLRVNKLSDAVQIVTICDTFDEMICGIGCEKVKVHEAIEYLKVFKNVKFSGTILDMFLQFTAVYPVGTGVHLSDGREGVVIRQNKEFSDRPVIRITVDKDGNQIDGEVIEDLIKVHHVFIEKVID